MNDTAINGATSELYLATLTGQYAVVVTNASGCVDTSAAFNFIATGVSNLAESESIQIFPNPTTGDLSIRLDGPASGALKVKLYHLQGRIVSLADIASLSANIFTMNISHCAAGLYYLEVQSDNWDEVRKVEVIK